MSGYGTCDGVFYLIMCLVTYEITDVWVDDCVLNLEMSFKGSG